MAAAVRGLFEQGAGFVLGVTLVAMGTTPTRIAGVLLLGVVYARNLEFVHACIHNTAFASRRANRVVGTLLSIPMLVSFAQWRREHIQHHRDVRREGFHYELDRLTTKRELLLHLFMARHFAASLAGMLGMRREYRLLLLAVAGGIAGCLFLHTAAPLIAWFAALPVAAVVHTHIELPEHIDCDRSSRSAAANSRVVRASRFATWLVHYNNYHAVHHWRAAVPNPQLPRLYLETPQPFIETTYPAFYRSFYTRFFG